MKKYTILFILMAVALSSGVYGQEQTKRVLPKGIRGPWDLLLPKRDTVIMRGEEIEVGAYLLKEKFLEEVEIVGFGKSKKSDFEKGYYAIKQKPKQTITYEFNWKPNKWGITDIRTVYVAKTEEEKKKLEEMLEKKRQEEKIKGKVVRLKNGVIKK